jgi:hypothetical protein
MLEFLRRDLQATWGRALEFILGNISAGRGIGDGNGFAGIIVIIDVRVDRQRRPLSPSIHF